MVIVIGLTGGIASGKSTVASFLREAGIPVIDADEIARQVVVQGQPALAEAVDAFGSSVLLPDGSLDRKALAARVFSDEAARRRLNEITHPHIQQAIARRRQALEAAGHRLVVLDVPLLFETGMEKSVDRTWVVAVSPGQQVRRLMDRDGLTVEEARRRIDAQMPLTDKISKADAVIDNSGSPEAARVRVKYLLAALLDDEGGEAR